MNYLLDFIRNFDNKIIWLNDFESDILYLNTDEAEVRVETESKIMFSVKEDVSEIFIPEEIKEIDYLDPFDKRDEWQ